MILADPSAQAEEDLLTADVSHQPVRLLERGEIERGLAEQKHALAALNADAVPVYDPQMAQRLVEAGMEVAALTPKQLAAWLAGIIALK